MSFLTAAQIADRLAQQAESVASYLLPSGKLKGGEWCVGDIGGAAGESLKVRVSGGKAGVWRDFAADSGGDLLDLWAQTRGIEMLAAMREASEYLGIQPPDIGRRPAATVKPPQGAAKASDDAKVWQWLTETRKLPEASLRAYRVGAYKGAVVLPAFTPDGKATQYLKYRSIGEKKFWSEQGGEPCLFGWQAIPKEAREVVIAEGECFPGTAQVMTRAGWVNIADYRGGEVAQYSGGALEWVYPIARVEKHYRGNLIRYETRGYVSMTTPGHNMVSIDHKGREYKHTAEQGPRSIANLIPRTGLLDGAGIALSDAQIKLGIAVSADATIDIRRQSVAGSVVRSRAAERRYARFAFKKSRKVARLREILSDCSLKASDNAVSNGYQSICLPLPEWVLGRMLPWEWIADATLAQREMILAELVHWDGNSVRNRNQTEYSSKYLENAEWVQALAHSTGRVSSIIRKKNKYGAWFKVSILHGKTTTSWQRLKNNAVRVPHDGPVYCVQVPSGALIVRQDEKITITGNCDALAWHAYGYPALSPTNGAGNIGWIDTEFDNLARFDTIYLAFDTDAAGQEAVPKIAERLGLERCRHVLLPRKDANECLMAGIEADEIFEAVKTAGTFDPPELVAAAALVDDVIGLLYPPDGREPGVALPWDKAAGKFLFRPGEVTILAGRNNSGKSQMAGQLLLAAMKQGERACVASLEFRPARWLVRLAIQASALREPSPDYVRAIHRWYQHRLWAFNATGTAKASRVLDVFGYAAARYGVRWFVVDNLAKCGFDEDDYNGQKGFVDRLGDFARDTQSHIILVHHTRKGATDNPIPTNGDLKGSGGLGDMADNVLLMWRDRRKEEARRLAEQSGAPFDEGNDPDALLIVDKARNGDATPTFALWFAQQCYQYVEGPRRTPRQFVSWSAVGEDVA